MNIIKNTNFHAGRNCGNRSERVQYIVIHYTGSEGTAANNVNYFNNGNRGASAHYFVDRSGEIREYCDPARYYAWHCGGPIESAFHPMYGKCTNRNSIGVEICTHYNGENWEFTTAAVSAAVELTKYLMQKFSVPAANVIRHYDVTGKSCPRVPGWGAVSGDAEWRKFKSRLTGAAVVVSLSKGDQGEDVKKMQEMLIACGYNCGKAGADGSWGADTEKAVLSFQADHNLATDGVFGPKTRAALEADYKAGKKREEKREEKQETPATDNAAFIKTIGELARKDQEKTGILACITVAQAILESGFGRSDLGKTAHNLFGMKCSLSGNTWSGSTWDGKSVYSKDTKEVYSSGPATVRADFRAYKNWAESVADHSAYLAGARKNGSALRYAGLVGCTDYKKAAEIIKAGGYATAPDYVSKLCRLVEQYGLTKYNAAEKKEEKKQEEKKESAAGKTETKTREIEIYFPSWPCQDSPDDRRGSGMLFIDQNGRCVVYDAFDKDSVPSGKLIKRMKEKGVTHYTAIGSHAHSDHLGGIYQMLDTAGIICDEFICYDPASLKLAGDGSANARSVKSDKAYLQKLIDKARSKGAKVRYVKTGDKIDVGEMSFIVYRNQPTKFTEYDDGHAWAYCNDGALGILETNSYTVWTSDGPGKGAEMLKYFKDYAVKVIDSPHHGNAAGMAYATAADDRGVVLVIEANNEKKGPGSCEFTQYGSRRFKQQGIPVWQLDGDIVGIARAGKMTWKQSGKKDISYAIKYGKGEPEPVEEIYRVRKTWTDSKSQVGAYKILKNAKDKADETGLTVYDSKGKAVYTGKKTETEPVKSFLVKVKTGMNVRRGPGTSYPAYRDCPVGIYTVVKTDGDWGELKAGGWIYIAQPRWVERV